MPHPFSSLARPGSWSGWVLAASTGLGVLALVLAPAYAGDGLRHVIMAGFSSVCHQLPDRSPYLGGVQLAVCHRCLGIYLAVAAAPFLYLVLGRWDELLQRHAGYLILAAVAVPAIDWLGGLGGLWINTAASRLVTGGVFGGVAGWFLTGACVRLASKRRAQSAAAS